MRQPELAALHGRIKVSGGGGQPPYQYALNEDAFGSPDSFSNLQAGIYTVRIKDASGYTVLADSVDVLPSRPLEVAELSTTFVTCRTNSGGISVRLPVNQSPVRLIVNDSVSTDNNITNLQVGTYALRMIDELGCQLDTTITLFAETCFAYLPNAFSPNGDGLNDRFQPFFATGVRAQIEYFEIFDRWGGLMYKIEQASSDTADYGWNGVSNGQPATPGVYAYKLRITYLNGIEQNLSGSLSLLK